MRYIIFGAGAVGSVYGGLLSHLGRNVILVGRSEHVARIQTHGLVVQQIRETLQVPIIATDTLSSIIPHPDDVLFVCVKSPQTAESLIQLKAHFPPHIRVVSFQNGVDNEPQLSTHFTQVYGALVNVNANFISPGVVRRTILDQIYFGKYPTGTDELTATLAADAAALGFRTGEHPKIVNLKWGKLLANLNNATLSLQNLWLQRALSIPENVALMERVVREGMRVLDTAGIDYTDDLGFFDIRVQVESMVRNHGSTAAVLVDTPEHERSYPSTWQDLRLDRPVTEVEWLNGEIVRLGKRFGVPTPCNSVLREGVLASVREHSGPGKYTLIQLLTAIEDEERRRE